jgi:hypothetical protein
LETKAAGTHNNETTKIETELICKQRFIDSFANELGVCSLRVNIMELFLLTDGRRTVKKIQPSLKNKALSQGDIGTEQFFASTTRQDVLKYHPEGEMGIGDGDGLTTPLVNVEESQSLKNDGLEQESLLNSAPTESVEVIEAAILEQMEDINIAMKLLVNRAHRMNSFMSYASAAFLSVVLMSISVWMYQHLPLEGSQKEYMPPPLSKENSWVHKTFY